MAESGDEVKDMEFDRADVNALKKRLRDNKLPHLTPSEERRLAAEEKARKEAEERARRAAKEKARLEAEARALAEAPRGSFSFKPEAVSLKLKEGAEAPAKIAVSFALAMTLDDSRESHMVIPQGCAAASRCRGEASDRPW